MLTDFLKDYLSIVIFIFIALGLSIGFIVLNFLFSPKNPDPEKLSAYECGFEAFGDSRMKFDVRFYLVAILFIIFDLEIAFLFPWAISLGNIGARILVNDDFSFCFNSWFCIRMEKRCTRLGLV